MKGAGNGGGSARIQDVLQLNDLFESLELRDPIASFERFIKILTKLIEILSRQGERRPERIRQHPRIPSASVRVKTSSIASPLTKFAVGVVPARPRNGGMVLKNLSAEGGKVLKSGQNRVPRF
jgi:hypothetical protein